VRWLFLKSDDVRTQLRRTRARRDNGGHRAGHRLGRSLSSWYGSRYRTYAPEGRHTDFASSDAVQISMPTSATSASRRNRQSLPNNSAPTALDRTRLILDAAPPADGAVSVVRWHPRDVHCEPGSRSRQPGAQVFATGGVYLGGRSPACGVGPGHRTPPRSFQRKGRFAALLARVPGPRHRLPRRDYRRRKPGFALARQRASAGL
jgi:hypothetical protein